MEPTYADLSVEPARLGNATVRYGNGRFGGDHLKLDAGGSVEFAFETDEDVVEAVLRVTALVSKSGRSPGYAPMTVLVNGEPVASRMTVPGGGDLPQDCDFAVPGRWLRRGRNQVTVRSGADARTMLWLYRVSVDSVHERGRAARAMASAADERSVLRYTTRRRVHSPAGEERRWEPAGRLLVHVDRGERAPIAQLSWRAADGAEAAIGFQSALGDFHGYHRDADGRLAEYRGHLVERRTYPEGTEGVTVHRFRTEEGWGGGWHASGELRMLVDDGGGAPVERLTWRDQRENSGSVAFEAEADGFLGYYQRVGEGPIGYRGTALAKGPADLV
ncbi:MULTISPECIES: hypothetical protein [Nocardiopsis]|uniref:OAA-family lectin sugar binding domain-containing protein n=1 Tax=Nocardiopsis sinuspersici TaxID=501010 RepID=A0A1V3BXL0_9ACTN|nr:MULTISPECIES: hypothetical protein [Nocardiopsis]OOC52840.1 hypothetical protein NOSIN_02540 [Nocardiopsis sinuspersici]